MSWSIVNNAFDCPQINPKRKYKRCNEYMLELEVVKDQTMNNESRSRVIDSRFAKFRATCLRPVKIYDTKTGLFVDEIMHQCGSFSIVYKVGTIAYPDKFDPDLEKICTHGLHYFNSLLAAYWFTISRLKEDVEFLENGQIRKVCQSSQLSDVQWIAAKFGLVNASFYSA
jgi:hypothetical protein